jgi:hypothetical protein
LALLAEPRGMATRQHLTKTQNNLLITGCPERSCLPSLSV